MNAPLTLQPQQTAQVQFVRDPQIPGRTAYSVTGATAEQVQDAISTLSRTVDTAFGGKPGIAQFTHPIRREEGWQSIGYVRFIPELRA